jgi:hypothetical protein
MDGPDLVRGACSCGWTGKGAGSERDARKATQSHVADATQNEIAAAVDNAENLGHTPGQVIAAARLINGPRDDIKTVAWERGTTALVVFHGEAGTGVIRYVLSGDLKTVIVCERVK